MANIELISEAENRAEEAQKLRAFAGLTLRHFREQVTEALSHFGKFGFLEEYTKHDISHIDSMLAMYEWLIPKATKEQMTPADWLLLTLTTYLHDFGLIVTRNEFDARSTVDAYQEFRARIIENEDPTMKDYRSEVERLSNDDAEKFMYQEFARYYHAERIRAWLQDRPAMTWGGDPRVAERLGTLLGELEETFREDVALVCESHHLDDMNNLRKYPLSKPYGSTPHEEANVQYVALMLRTADLLHVTDDRVPSMAALIINPRNPKSQVEWAKQRAVKRVRPRPPIATAEGTDEHEENDTIEVHANFKDAEGYFGLTGYLQYAVKQLQQSYAWSNENQATQSSSYLFPWRRIDRTHIAAKGFVTEQFTFSIDQAKILDLLTGHTLYNDTGVVVRELVQNSLDAVRLQQYLAGQGNEDYTPRIDVVWNTDERTLTVTDNGVGMSQAVIEQNFLHVGSSRYQEPEFKKEFPDFSSISRFGIGVLSTFMVADDVTVTTVHETEVEARKLSLRDVHGQYLVRLINPQNPEVPSEIRRHGTSVSMKLRPSAELQQVDSVLRQWIVLPGCDVYLTVNAEAPTLIGFKSVTEALQEALIEADLVRVVDGRSFNRYGSPLEIRTAEYEGLDIAFAVTWNEWLQDWGYIRLNPDPEQGVERVLDFGVCVSGVRVTNQPPGFIYGGIAALANASGKTAPRTNVARSAIEKTPEYDSMLGKIYQAYVGHIDTEMHELADRRASSLTRAVQEASYLAEELARFEPESVRIRDQKLRTVPGTIIEKEGVRTAYSIEQLSEFDELATIESTTVASFEGVLRSVRGSRSPSLRNLIDAMGSDEELPSAPLICGMPRIGLVSDMFASEWEVVRLESDKDGRTLKATWNRKGEIPRWEAYDPRTGVPQSLARLVEREAGYGRIGDRIPRTLFPRGSENIELNGIADKKLVVCQGWLLVLPGYEILDIAKASSSVPDSARLWALSWIIRTLSRDSGSYRLRSAAPLREASGTQWLPAVVDSFRNNGLFRVLDEDSTRQALASVDLEPLDVLRWDRRTSPE